jgi:hypothetical protein
MANVANLLIPPGKPSPDIIVHGAESTAPPAATVLADSGPIVLAAKVLVLVNWGADDNVATPEIAHRNAANSADLEVDYPGVPAGASSFVSWFVVAAGERIVVRNKVVGTAAKVYQAALFLWILP